MTYGFSVMGFACFMVILAPSFYWVNRPEYEAYHLRKKGIFQGLDRLGLTASGCILLIFRDFDYQGLTPWLSFLILTWVLLLLYTLHWIFCLSRRRLPMTLGKIPMTVLSPAAICTLAIYGKAPWLLLTAILYGIGHCLGDTDTPQQTWACCCSDSCQNDSPSP